MKDKILIMPGTIWQIPLMKKIKSMGYELHVVNPIRNDGVYQLADYFFESDIFAFDEVLGYCKKHNIRAVMSDECDIATTTVAKLNRILGANALSEELAELFTNKFRMREFCKINNFNPIPYFICSNKNEAYAFFDKNGDKAIIKPIDSNASHGVFTIASHNDIDIYFDEALKYSRSAEAVLIEKYIEGTEFTVDGIMTAKGHETLAISEKGHYRHNNNIANSLLFRQKSTRFDYDLLTQTNDNLINASGLSFGLTHVEYKFSNGKYYLIEMAARGGGNLISAIIAPFMSQIDNYDYLIRCTLDRRYKKSISAIKKNERTAILKFLDLPCQNGVVKKIEGEEYLSIEPCIKSYKLNFKEGDFVHQPENDSVRIGYYIICADNYGQFETVVQNINKYFKVFVE